MDFQQTDERRMLADTLTRFVAQDYPLDARLAAGAGVPGYAPEKWRALADLGVHGALFDPRDGGYGGAGFDLMVVFEAVGRGLIVEPLLASAVLAGGALAQAADPKTKSGQKEHLAGLVSGEKQATLAHFEANDGWDPTHIETTARKTDGGWVLNGKKSVVRAAESADFLICSARSSGVPGDKDGLSLFLLEMDGPKDGVTLQSSQTIDGGRVSDITLGDVTLPETALIGRAGQAWAPLQSVLGRGVMCLSAEAVGLMDVIRDMTLEYLRTRKQFGQPIGRFQALQHRMATQVL